MSRLLVLLFIASLLLLYLAPAFADGDTPLLPALRYSTAPEKVRVVVDLPAPATFTNRSTPAQVQVGLSTSLAQALTPVTVVDPIVTEIALAPDVAGLAVLKVTLTKARKIQVSTLPADGDKPFRLVVDVLKNYSIEERRQLNPAITYMRIERQTDDAYLACHIVEIDTRLPGVRLAAVAAQGGHERVCAMAGRTGADCGVNGGYFLSNTDTRPVGLLKVDNQVLSMPLWGRTAVAFPPSGPPEIFTPQGVWHVTLPDGTTRDLHESLDAIALAPVPSAVVINGNTFSQAPANPDGLTVIIRDGKVAARLTANSPLAPGEFALQLDGDEAKALDAQLQVGAVVTLTPVLTPDLADYPCAVGAGPRLLRHGLVEVTGQAERFKPDILTGRAARTGLGITADKRVVLAVVEPPCAYGGGATLEDLAKLLKEHGAEDALNLDGGGSSTLALGATTVNYPEGAWVRPVASGVMVYTEKEKKDATAGIVEK